MKWFRHETDAIHSEKLAKLIMEFGFEGYGRYWRLMELVAERMDKTQRCFLELPEKDWLRYLSIRRPLFRRYLVVICQLFDIKQITNGLLLRIEIPKLLEKRDNYTKDLEVTSKKLPSKEVEVEVEVEKPIKRKLSFSLQDKQTAEAMFKKMREFLPNSKDPNFKLWANDIRLIREQDGKSLSQILDLFYGLILIPSGDRIFKAPRSCESIGTCWRGRKRVALRGLL